MFECCQNICVLKRSICCMKRRRPNSAMSLPLVDFTELFKVHLLSFSMVSCQTISNTISNRTNKLYLYLYFLNLYLYFLNFTELLVHLLREKLATYLGHHLQPDQQISVKVLFLPPQSLSNFCMGNFSGDLTWGLWLAKKSKGMPMLDQREVDTIHRGLITIRLNTNMCQFKIS